MDHNDHNRDGQSSAPERDPETLEMFVEEALEALTRVEKILMEAERGSPPANAISVLFRDMHTIKGTSAFLAFDRITRLAHAAEDLMASVRDGDLEPTQMHFVMLLRVVDGLRSMVESAREHGDEGPGDYGPLTAELRAALSGELPAQPAEPVAPPPEPAAASALPAAASAPALGVAAEPHDADLGEMLVAQGLITRQQLNVALASRNGGRLGETLLRMGAINEQSLGRAMVATTVEVRRTSGALPSPLTALRLASQELPPARRASQELAAVRTAQAPAAAQASAAAQAPVAAPAPAPARHGSQELPPPRAAARPEPEKAGEKVGEKAGEKAAEKAAEKPAEPRAAGADKAAADHHPDGSRGEAAGEGTVRVSVHVLDRLMNLMGELVLARNQMVQIAKTSRDGNVNALAAAQRLGLVTSEMQEQIMKTRMQPVARVFEKIPRMVRDLSQAVGKQVECVIEGNNTELDRALIEAIRDPVMHMVRNSLDHGLEPPADRTRAGKPATGKLFVRAAHEAGMVCIEIGDDGRGMDPDRIIAHAIRRGVLTAPEAARLSDREVLDLVFRPGFSTAEQVTSISGRGVGMDVVKTSVERAGGQVELTSQVGRGTSVRLKMPLTLAIIPALLVRSGPQRFCIPQINLLELVYLNDDQARVQIERVRNAEVYRLRGEVLPLVRLGKVLGHPPPPPTAGTSIVVVANGKQRYGLVVDEILDTEEIVVKPLHPRLKKLACYAGATVLGDGGVALILEVAGIAEYAGSAVPSLRDQANDQPSASQAHTQSLLVFDAGEDTRCAVPLAIVARLERIPTRSLERVAGREVVQYRGTIMPLIRPERGVPIGSGRAVDDTLQVVVFDFGSPVGMLVNEIIDVVDAEVLTESSLLPECVLGQAIVFGRTTLLLDVYELVRRLAPGHSLERSKQVAKRSRVMLIDDSTVMRTVVATFLRSTGLDVDEHASGVDALAALRADHKGEYDAVVTDLELPEIDGLEIVTLARAERPELPVIVWTHHDVTRMRDVALRAGAAACINKHHREQLVAALTAAGVSKMRGASA